MIAFIIMLVWNTCLVFLVLIPLYLVWNFIFMSFREALFLFWGVNTFTREELENIYGVEIKHPAKVEILPKDEYRNFDYIDLEALHRRQRRRRK